MQSEIKAYDFQKGEILVFDKPLDWTSFDLVHKVRYIICKNLKIKKLKVGHAGTLDPKATGILILCTGKATSKIETLQADEKEYVATLKLGATTPSYDLESAEDRQFDTSHISKDVLVEVLKQFIGIIAQVPPEYSAIKIDGKRAYEYARKGIAIEIMPKILEVKEIEVLSFSLPEVKLRIVCGKGTYIRALARDIGEALQSGAYLTGLRRTRVGDYDLNQAINLVDFLKSNPNNTGIQIISNDILY
ncbi:MAG: tRNA pseudouridine(55) synthase TruB [Bacteroidia bacterium]|nr:tRNA pseudouridine(55) synthase TruB [Bacteroidia bacterium]